MTASRPPAGVTALAASAVVALLLAGCTSDDEPKPSAKTGGNNGGSTASAPAPCHTDTLAGWSKQGLAVLWIPESTPPGAKVATPAAVTAVDVHSGAVRSYCPLPTGTAPKAETLPMRWGGVDYPEYQPDLDLMLATQWFSPDFRWFAAPGASLVDVSTGEAVDLPDLPAGGAVIGVGRDVALVRAGEGAAVTWCTQPLPPGDGKPCTPLTPADGSGPGGFVIGADGLPTWLSGEATPLRVDQTTAYVVHDGQRIYRADTETAQVRRSKGPAGELGASVDIAPSGLAGFQALIDEQPTHDLAGWFTIDSIRPGAGSAGLVRASHHQTTARDSAFDWLLGKDSEVSRTVADGGTVAVSARLRTDRAGGLSTHFGVLRDNSDQVVDLTEERGIGCPVKGTLCRIMTWPDKSLDAEDE